VGWRKGLSKGSEESNLWASLLVHMRTESESLELHLGWLTGTAMGEVMAADKPSEGQAVEQRRRGWWLVKGENVGLGMGLTYDPRQRLTGSWQSSVHVCDG
jgi:hypothetical protein